MTRWKLSDNDNIIAIGTDGEYQKWLGAIRFSHDGYMPTAEEREILRDNARLAVSAPEMLECLADAVPYLVDAQAEEHRHRCDDMCTDACDVLCGILNQCRLLGATHKALNDALLEAQVEEKS